MDKTGFSVNGVGLLLSKFRIHGIGSMFMKGGGVIKTIS